MLAKTWGCLHPRCINPKHLDKLFRDYPVGEDRRRQDRCGFRENMDERSFRRPTGLCGHPEQPWLDGFNVSEDFIRQFIAMPLGEGFTAEEQITGKAEHGGLQIIVYPMKHEGVCRTVS